MFSTLETVDVRFCAVVARASLVLGEDSKSAFEELFVFALGGPRAPSGVERQNFGAAAQGGRRAVEVGLGLVLE